MCIHTSSRSKSNRSHIKTEFQMFSLISDRHVGSSSQTLITLSIKSLRECGTAVAVV